MKIKVLVFVFIVCGVILGCSLGSKSRLLEDHATLKINGKDVTRFDTLNPVQQAAVLGGTYKLEVTGTNDDNSCVVKNQTNNTKDGVVIKLSEECKTKIKEDSSNITVQINLEILSSSGQVLLKTQPTAFTVGEDKNIHLKLQLEKTDALDNITDESVADDRYEIKDGNGYTIISYDGHGKVTIGEEYVCCKGSNQVKELQQVTGIKKCSSTTCEPEVTPISDKKLVDAKFQGLIRGVSTCEFSLGLIKIELFNGDTEVCYMTFASE